MQSKISSAGLDEIQAKLQKSAGAQVDHIEARTYANNCCDRSQHWKHFNVHKFTKSGAQAFARLKREIMPTTVAAWTQQLFSAVQLQAASTQQLCCTNGLNEATLPTVDWVNKEHYNQQWWGGGGGWGYLVKLLVILRRKKTTRLYASKCWLGEQRTKQGWQCWWSWWMGQRTTVMNFDKDAVMIYKITPIRVFDYIWNV